MGANYDSVARQRNSNEQLPTIKTLFAARQEQSLDAVGVGQYYDYGSKHSSANRISKIPNQKP